MGFVFLGHDKQKSIFTAAEKTTERDFVDQTLVKDSLSCFCFWESCQTHCLPFNWDFYHGHMETVEG